MACALKVLDPEEHNRDLKQPRNGLSDKLALHSVDQMHDFMHNLKADADPKEIKRIWERWHPYLELLFATLAAQPERGGRSCATLLSRRLHTYRRPPMQFITPLPYPSGKGRLTHRITEPMEP